MVNCVLQTTVTLQHGNLCVVGKTIEKINHFNCTRIYQQLMKNGQPLLYTNELKAETKKNSNQEDFKFDSTVVACQMNVISALE